MNISNHPLFLRVCFFHIRQIHQKFQMKHPTSRPTQIRKHRQSALREKSAEFAYHPKSCPCPKNYGIPFFRSLRDCLARVIFRTPHPSEKILCVLGVGKGI
ncbi:hypothetical protein CDAR_484871 [Caerostris darwini]|uniref:Uncharacterized protein n=1 Tax=Caerostris darwini TaxID=1538125 RepID=A0AAV4PBX4_9ARAC|nr:hypothetical protein CDAR_484871 [Caerostris darwini]